MNYSYLNSSILKYHWDEAKSKINDLKNKIKSKEQED